jgi:hypothetical protein
MEAIRKILPAEVMSTLVDLPWKSKNMKVEVIVMPVDEAVAAMRAPDKSLKGRLKAYADPTLAGKEGAAWAEHIAKKYGTV